MYQIPKGRLIILRIITCVVIFFALIISLVAGFFVVYTRTYVNGTSMSPTLNEMYSQTGKRDKVYINRFNKGKVGDIVVLDLRQDANFGNYTIKRLIALEGDIVNIEFDSQELQYNLVVNGKVIQSKQNKQGGYNSYGCFVDYVTMHEQDETRVIKNEQNEVEGIIIKKGEIFVLGDNWDVSKDSSLVGPIDKNTIVGRVDIVVRPKQNEFLTILKRIF